MEETQKKIVLSPNAGRDLGFEMTRKVDGMLRKLGRQTVVCPMFDDDYFIDVPGDLETAALEDEISSAEMIISLGGDGTILRAARAAAEHGIPVLGVNMGGKGFMADLEVEDIGLIDKAASGEYKLGRRMMLDIEVIRNGKIICGDCALNDVIIKGANKVIELTLHGDGQKIFHFSGDGAVIATPTGSTAYSMSAGGPIVEPSAHNIIVTPVCAHVLEAKSFVLVDERCVSVEIGHRRHNTAYMSVDGCDYVPIYVGDTVNVRKSEKYTHFVQISNRSFYKKVSEKLGEQL